MPTEVMGILDQLRWVRWLLSNADKLSKIMDHVTMFQAVQTLPEKWSCLKTIGDIIIDVIDSAPVHMSGVEIKAIAAEGEFAAHRAAAITAGINWDKLVALLPQIAALVQAILKILRGE